MKKEGRVYLAVNIKTVWRSLNSQTIICTSWSKILKGLKIKAPQDDLHNLASTLHPMIVITNEEQAPATERGCLLSRESRGSEDPGLGKTNQTWEEPRTHSPTSSSTYIRGWPSSHARKVPSSSILSPFSNSPPALEVNSVMFRCTAGQARLASKLVLLLKKKGKRKQEKEKGSLKQGHSSFKIVNFWFMSHIIKDIMLSCLSYYPSMWPSLVHLGAQLWRGISIIENKWKLRTLLRIFEILEMTNVQWGSYTGDTSRNLWGFFANNQH